MKKSLIPENFQVAIIALVVFLLYIVAMVYPDTWWGLHYPSFLGGGQGWFVVLVAIAVTVYSTRSSFWEKLAVTNLKGNNWLWIAGISLLAGFFFYSLPIYHDIYGDALTIIPSYDFVNSEFSEKQSEMLTSMDFTNLKIGYDTTLGIIAWLSFTKEMSLGEAFRTVGAISGAGYVFFMLATAFRISRNNLQKLLFALIILGAPITLVFCGHIEIYAPVLFLLAAFWYAIVRFHENPGWITGGIVLLLCVLNLKFHVSGVLTFLIFGTSLLILVMNRMGKGITWSKFGVTVLGVFTALGFSIYTLVTKSVFGPRSYSEDNLTDAIFLPIKTTDPAPLDRYNLFSWNHLFDYFNMAFLWSGIAIVIIVVALVFKRKSTHWNNPLVMLSGLGFVFYFITFFVLNPLLSMPTDWDLMSIPAIALIMFAMTVVSQAKSDDKNETRSFSSYLVAPAFGLFLIGLTGIFVNANQETLSNRLMSVGKYSFKTYWIGSSTPITEAVKLKKGEKEQYAMLEDAVLELESYHVEGADLEYAALLNLMGDYQQEYFKDVKAAHGWYLKSEKADEHLMVNVFDLTVSYFKLKDYNSAHGYVKNLIFNKYPSHEKALYLATRISLGAGELDFARKYCDALLKIKPGNTKYQELRALIERNPDASEINNMDAEDSELFDDSDENKQQGDALFRKLMDHFNKEEFKKAFQISQELVEMKFPSERKSLRVAIHCALEAENYDAAKRYCEQLLRVNPEDTFIRKVLHLLDTSEDKSSIKKAFRQS